MFAKFSTTSSALQLLQVGECDRVTRLAPECDARVTASLYAAGGAVWTPRSPTYFVLSNVSAATAAIQAAAETG